MEGSFREELDDAVERSSTSGGVNGMESMDDVLSASSAGDGGRTGERVK